MEWLTLGLDLSGAFTTGLGTFTDGILLGGAIRFNDQLSWNLGVAVSETDLQMMVRSGVTILF